MLAVSLCFGVAVTCVQSPSFVDPVAVRTVAAREQSHMGATLTTVRGRCYAAPDQQGNAGPGSELRR
ncbi:hypothetical protein PA7_33620 [Pseudonocardia asaccharolytica DSM 44247 = NBRC 16224]|uniref:Uncharacterized protein n=1 Tax=Pseudonocardia asaccharolytica DSM 44247 = NBRC 16224 TaxID=1123024 RepID=A0A511D416_9PSEU|nr:hypothetical protein PA7_33620 [Pseudonocardia asaccharolytica DSM 44247 = NBRC 16224]